MVRKYPLILLCLFLVTVCHTNTARGPDSTVYLKVAQRIVTEGHLNILAKQLSSGTPWQITRSNHEPIHQNVGGVLFLLPATAAAFVSVTVASWIPDLPARLYDINYHQNLWVGSVSCVLALLFCLLMYRVGCRYASSPAVIGALLSCYYGGPLLIYSAGYPCQMHLPVAFLAALLLYCYHFSDLDKKRTWLLLGALWGLGVFVRAEFVVWALFVLHGIIALRPSGGSGWRQVLIRGGLACGGGVLFLVPAAMIRQVLFGMPGSTYGIQFDLAILSRSYLMLAGWRNGLFTFWPVLAVALAGYGLRPRQNPALFHVLAAILVMVTLICGATNFWSGDYGNSFGQRRFLVVLPCFILFLARLFDLGRRYFFWLAALCAVAALWSLSLYCVYGDLWRFADGRVGFLMPYHLSFMLSVLADCAPELPARLLRLVLMPKHSDTSWLVPFLAIGGGALYAAGRSLRRRLPGCGLVVLVAIACLTTGFLSGARQRGEAAFVTIARSNPGARFIVRNYEVDGEITGSMVDVVSFFMEIGQPQVAQYFVDKASRFFAAEAPDQIEPFMEMVAALGLRQSMGWYRLVPEQDHAAMRNWYLEAVSDSDAGRGALDISGQFLY